MSRPVTIRTYGKQSRRPKAGRLFAELPQTPVRLEPRPDPIASLTEQLTSLDINQDENTPPSKHFSIAPIRVGVTEEKELQITVEVDSADPRCDHEDEQSTTTDDTPGETLRILTWDDVCPPGDKIEKIAEASYAEVYRVTNDKGTSIIKVIRLHSPIKAQTKTQQRAGLVDEEPHSESDLKGELQISEWLADIPGFVVYKERYIVRGKACHGLLETHQSFHRKMKRRDPDRLQFYPSPSRYLDDTKFLVVELGDAGTALEDFALVDSSQLWDIFFLVAIALARAEDLILFEHRDLHEGNLCIRKSGKQSALPRDSNFGASGLDITILDYGLSRAEDVSQHDGDPVSYDLEKDLGIFTSTHAAQCTVYRQMRSFLLTGERTCLPPQEHHTPYEAGIDGPISWDTYASYTNVLWLAYIYQYLVRNFKGDKKELAQYKRITRELWTYLNPEAKREVPCFASAADVVRFAVEAGWIQPDQLCGSDGSLAAEREDSIIISRDDDCLPLESGSLRRSPRRRRQT
jgi:serine/threonine-protein kinase haspin